MGIYLNPGNMHFQKALNSEIYIDKTMLIDFTNRCLNTEQGYICVSRPRRFGKSMAANMLTAYYSMGCDSKEMFQNLKIARQPDFNIHLNHYNVIHINMQTALSISKNMDQNLQNLEADLIDELESAFPDIKIPRRKTLLKLFQYIFESRKIPFIFIIDEWDCIFRIHQNDLHAQKQYLDFLRSLLKDQAYVALAYMTGILPIKKYGEHSAINVFYEYSMTHAKPIERFTGFTEQEVQMLCSRYHMPFETARHWYDGYCVDGLSLYNPKSMVEAMLRGRFDNYWTQTETYEALKIYIQMNFDGLKTNIVRMIAGEKVTINPAKFQNDMITFQSADDVLTLFVHLGYLTFDFQTKQVWIPNGEVQQEFINCMEDSEWEPVMSAIRQSEELLFATFAGDEQAVAEHLKRIHQENTSILHYHDENSLSCVVSLAYYAAKKYYSVYRELPAGKGFADLVFIPLKECSKPALIIELKWKRSAAAAIQQIYHKEYKNGLKDYSGEVLLVAINYGKDKTYSCKIERMQI